MQKSKAKIGPGLLSSNIIDLVAGFFQAKQEILEAYIFGSSINGNSSKFSDIDIAVNVDYAKISENSYPYGYKSSLLSQLLSLLSRNNMTWCY